MGKMLKEYREYRNLLVISETKVHGLIMDGNRRFLTEIMDRMHYDYN